MIMAGCSKVPSESKNEEIPTEQEDPDLLLINNTQQVAKEIEIAASKCISVIYSLKKYTANCENLEDGEEAQIFFNNLLQEEDIQDSITISYLDSNHTFIYSFINDVQDPAQLVGTNVTSIRDRDEIDDLNEIMEDTMLHFFDPINLVEGYPGIPINYGVKRNDQLLGYVSAIINFRSLINRVYEEVSLTSIFAYRFKIKDGPVLDREKVYDETAEYNFNKDPEFFENFDIREEDFYTELVSVEGFNLEISAAYKK